MFLSNEMKRFIGVRRRSESKLGQTGSRMKMTSTCSTRAALRAIAVEKSGRGRHKRGFVLTGSDLKGMPGGVIVIFVKETEDGNQHMQENPCEEEQSPS